MPRFVILRHETPTEYERPTHFDFMLEHEGALWTWALEKIPASGEAIVAQRLPDHRLAYLEFEGEIEGNRGRVTRIDSGEYEPLEAKTTNVQIRLQGQRLTG